MDYDIHAGASGDVRQRAEKICAKKERAAANLLRQSRVPVASIALDAGHESEAAFSRAFKRLVGTPPASWRRIQNREWELCVIRGGHDW